MGPRERPEEMLGSATTEVDSSERPRVRSGDVATASPPAFQPGALLANRYRIVRFIARGGMGEVYEAEDLTLHMKVALKSIAPDAAADAKMISRLKREVLLARKVTHPNVCRLHDLGTHVSDAGAITFLTMDLLQGETLAAHVARTGRLGIGEALPIARDMASALDAAHRAGVIHRDFKSRNVIVEEAGEGGAPKAVVMDFGIAIAAAEDERRVHDTGEGHFVGTPAYMAPEQVSGAPSTAATDVYAFGVVLFEMVTGRMPFVSDNALEVITMRLVQDPPSPRALVPGLDPRWSQVILRCLARDPTVRFARAGDAVAALVAPRPIVTRGRLLLGASVALAGLAAVAGGRRIQAMRSAPVASTRAELAQPPPADTPRRRPTLAVVSMSNVTGDPAAQWVSTALADMLRSELQADEALRVVPADRIARARRDLGLGDDRGDARIAPETLARIRDNVSSDYLITGRYTTGEGEALHLEVTLDDPRGGAASGAPLAFDGARSKLLDLVATTGASLRKRLGLRAPSAAEAVAARAASPGTPEAARAYAEGEAKLVASDLRGALESFQRAVAADPAFPLAHAGLAMAASSLGDDATALEEGKKAFESSSGLSREEQLMIEARYRIMAKQWDRASEIWRTLFGFFPDNLEYGLRYAQSLWAAGRPNEAFPVIVALRALPAPEKDDPRIDYYESIAAAKTSDFHRMAAAGRVAAEKAERIGAWSLAAHGHHQVAEAHAYLREEDAALPEWEKSREEYAKIADRQGEADSLKGLGNVYADSGDPGRALPIQERALALTREIGSRYKIANGVSDVGGTRYALGDTAAARALFDEARGLYEAIHDREGIGNSLGNKARTLWDDGDLAGARAMSAEGRAKLREVGERDGVTSVTIDLARMALDAGDLAGAGGELADAEALAKELGIAFYASRCKLVRAEIAREAGDRPLSRRLAEEARGELRDAHAGTDVREADLLLARIALDEGRVTEAESLARGVAEGARASLEKPLEATGLALLALSTAAQKRGAEATEAVDRASALAATQVKVRIDLAIARAAVVPASPEGMEAALRKLTEGRALAEKAGFVPMLLDVRLAIGRLARGGESRGLLKGLAADATAKGFGRVALLAEEGAKLVVSGEAPAGRGGPR